MHSMRWRLQLPVHTRPDRVPQRDHLCSRLAATSRMFPTNHKMVSISIRFFFFYHVVATFCVLRRDLPELHAWHHLQGSARLCYPMHPCQRMPSRSVPAGRTHPHIRPPVRLVRRHILLPGPIVPSCMQARLDYMPSWLGANPGCHAHKRSCLRPLPARLLPGRHFAHMHHLHSSLRPWSVPCPLPCAHWRPSR